MVMLTMLSTLAVPALSKACLGGRGGQADVNPRSTLLESTSHSPIVLRPEGVRSRLRPTEELAQVSSGQVLRRAVASRRLMLLLCDLRAAQTPETLFHVYLNLPEQADRGTHKRHLLTQFNFFSAARPGDTTAPVWQSADITHVVGALAEQGMLEEEATLTILAARPFDVESRPTIGRLAILKQ